MFKLCCCQPLLYSHFLSGVFRPLDCLFPMKTCLNRQSVSAFQRTSTAPFDSHNLSMKYCFHSVRGKKANKQTNKTHFSASFNCNSTLCFFLLCIAENICLFFFALTHKFLSPPTFFFFHKS